MLNFGADDWKISCFIIIIYLMFSSLKLNDVI